MIYRFRNHNMEYHDIPSRGIGRAVDVHQKVHIKQWVEMFGRDPSRNPYREFTFTGATARVGQPRHSGGLRERRRGSFEQRVDYAMETFAGPAFAGPGA
jgi:hypothetical protein